jgi:hypothetical protein
MLHAVVKHSLELGKQQSLEQADFAVDGTIYVKDKISKSKS